MLVSENLSPQSSVRWQAVFQLLHQPFHLFALVLLLLSPASHSGALYRVSASPGSLSFDDRTLASKAS
jgi:hypothetical protein